MALLIQFLLRLAFGLALGMTFVSAADTPSGYFRNHLYVVLGLTAFAALLSQAAAPPALPWAVAAAILSYLGAVCWLLEKASAGKAALVSVAAISLIAALAALPHAYPSPADISVADTSLPRPPQPQLLRGLQTVTSGTLLGVTMAAMLLGHWYLNAPGMQLRPLQRLLTLMFAAVGVQTAVSLGGLALVLGRDASIANVQWLLFLALRWLFGLVGVAALTWMARETLRIPNTQSATGILYVAVIGSFVGEIMSLLLSVESSVPL